MGKTQTAWESSSSCLGKLSPSTPIPANPAAVSPCSLLQVLSFSSSKGLRKFTQPSKHQPQSSLWKDAYDASAPRHVHEDIGTKGKEPGGPMARDPLGCSEAQEHHELVGGLFGVDWAWTHTYWAEAPHLHTPAATCSQPHAKDCFLAHCAPSGWRTK